MKNYISATPKVLKTVDQNERGIKEFVELLLVLIFFGNTYKEVTDENSPGGKKVVTREYLGLLSKVFEIKNLIGDAVDGIDQIPDELLDKITPEEREVIKATLGQLKWLQENQQLDEAVDDHIDWVVQTQKILKKHYGLFDGKEK